VEKQGGRVRETGAPAVAIARTSEVNCPSALGMRDAGKALTCWSSQGLKRGVPGEREGTMAEAEKRGLRQRVGGGTTGRAPAIVGGSDGGGVPGRAPVVLGGSDGGGAVGVAGGTGSGTKAATHWATSAMEEHSVWPAAVR
jgi:hypothetical protein